MFCLKLSHIKVEPNVGEERRIALVSSSFMIGVKRFLALTRWPQKSFFVFYGNWLVFFKKNSYLIVSKVA
jgi:hypothetical protein